MTDIFISYSKADYDTAKSLADEMTRDGLTVWWDYNIVGGHSFTRAIMQALDEATVVIVIWSDTSVKSDYVLDEAEYAKDQGKLVTTRLSDFDVKNLPVGFRRFQSYPVTDRERLKQALAGFDLEPADSPASKLTDRLPEQGQFHREPGRPPVVRPAAPVDAEPVQPTPSETLQGDIEREKRQPVPPSNSDGAWRDSVWPRLIFAGAAVAITLMLFGSIM